MALGGVPLPESEEAIFTEFLKETERRRAVHIRVLYLYSGSECWSLVGDDATRIYKRTVSHVNVEVVKWYIMMVKCVESFRNVDGHARLVVVFPVLLGV